MQGALTAFFGQPVRVVAQPADDNQPPPAPTEPPWEEKLRQQELKAARMAIEWNLPPRPGPQ